MSSRRIELLLALLMWKKGVRSNSFIHRGFYYLKQLDGVPALAGESKVTKLVFHPALLGSASPEVLITTLYFLLRAERCCNGHE